MSSISADPICWGTARQCLSKVPYSAHFDGWMYFDYKYMYLEWGIGLKIEERERAGWEEREIREGKMGGREKEK